MNCPNDERDSTGTGVCPALYGGGVGHQQIAFEFHPDSVHTPADRGASRMDGAHTTDRRTERIIIWTY
jgi:hypothetical protein